jgi:hypothetical protein
VDLYFLAIDQWFLIGGARTPSGFETCQLFFLEVKSSKTQINHRHISTTVLFHELYLLILYVF